MKYYQTSVLEESTDTQLNFTVPGKVPRCVVPTCLKAKVFRVCSEWQHSKAGRKPLKIGQFLLKRIPGVAICCTPQTAMAEICYVETGKTELG